MARVTSALERVRPVFRAVATTVVPDAAGLGAAEWADVEAIVIRALAGRPPRMQRQLTLFLRLLDWLPLLRYGRRFTALDALRRTRFLSFIQWRVPLLVRRGFWGVRTLVLMGYYGRPAAATAIGYRGDPRGGEGG